MSNLTVRLPRIDVASMEMEPLWLGGDAFRTHVFNAMSMLFPIGEQYFIDAVRLALPEIDDPALQNDVRHFIGQEATHSRLHRAFNARLARQGLHNRVEPAIAWRIRLTQGMGLRAKLAIAMAYEHFTATFGDAILGEGDWLEGASEPMRVLWTWHAVEESEHRAVIFDVYRASGGGYAGRIGAFLYVSLMLALDTTFQTLDNLWRGGLLGRAATWARGARFLFARHGVIRQTLPAWFAYFLPDFSPRNREDRGAARRWLDQNKAWFPTPPNPPRTGRN